MRPCSGLTHGGGETHRLRFQKSTGLAATGVGLLDYALSGMRQQTENALERVNWHLGFESLLMPRRDFQLQTASSQERLAVRLAATERVDFEFVGEHIEFAAHQSMGPMLGDGNGTFEQTESSHIVGAPQKDDLSLTKGLRQDWRIWMAPGRTIDPCGMAGAMCRDETTGSRAHTGQTLEAKALPDLGLPQMIETFDLRLKPGFSRRRKDGHDAKAQAEVDDAAESAGGGMCALKASVVIELRVVRQTASTPMFRQGCEHPCRRPSGGRPGLGQAAVERNCIEQFDLRTVTNDQAFDKIKRVEFGLSGRQCRQIPTGRGRRMTLASALGEQSVSSEDALDRTDARKRGEVFLLESATYRRGTELAQGAVLLEPRAEGNDALRQTLWCSVVRAWIAPRTILPIDPIQTQTKGAVKPAVSRIEADQEAAGHGAKRGTTAQCSNNESSLEIGFFSAIAESFGVFNEMTTRRPTGPRGGCVPARYARLHSATTRPCRLLHHTQSVLHLLSLKRSPLPVACPLIL